MDGLPKRQPRSSEAPASAQESHSGHTEASLKAIAEGIGNISLDQAQSTDDAEPDQQTTEQQ